MVTGYSGSYRAVVVDTNDPQSERRLLVMVPDVYGAATAWAAPSTNGGDVLPSIDDVVWVSFEHGDSDFPVWSTSESESETGAHTGFIGVYRGTVIDNADPADQRRLLVNVPDVTTSDQWASPGWEVVDGEVPDIGATVWVEYEYGDPQYPRWTGVA